MNWARDHTCCDGGYNHRASSRCDIPGSKYATSQYYNSGTDTGLIPFEFNGPNKPYKKPGLMYRPGQAEGVGLCGAA